MTPSDSTWTSAVGGRVVTWLRTANELGRRLARPLRGPAARIRERMLSRRATRRSGWRVVAEKEFADHITSIRFLVLLVVIGLACLAAVVSAASFLRESATEASDATSVFLLLFTQSPEQIPSFVALIGFLGPLLGIAFGFDAVNQERSDRTLPRLVSQPIHRDDIVNGKFVAGLAVIGLTLVALVALTAGVGIVRMGITPSAGDVARLLLYLVVALVYMGLWLAFALLCSVLLRRPATAALVAIAAWLVFTLFGTFLASLAADAFSGEGQIAQARTEYSLSLVSPSTLYENSSAALLNPEVRSVGLLLPQDLERAVPGPLSLDQSLLVVWPQVTALVAASVVMFTLGYVAFLRQEVRA
ncbi:ABC transporter permease [Actinobacteria bacterium YIM 96077]|uniref:ABC transporter permease n=1 Tax=Phytoactinopolyspora halophila TaxID=1981511 RepID=A0A329R3R3_9ACTN|nr:ABC transporter permease subunit [Phytoactinopolyspora halophila]AYY13122.1 ABC transporter permease [Actinobacteria bacterium YIM 96077]RAW17638.1 ABC transporter permease [Phytoactinopolyspora halophila]